jgi:hypothetical protein
MRWALPMDGIRLTRSLLRAARRVVDFPDVRSESAGESIEPRTPHGRGPATDRTSA